MRRMSWRRTAAAVGWCGLMLAHPARAAVQVVATIYPLADIVRQVGGGHVTVTALLPPGATPHTFEPAPVQVEQVARADVFVAVGAGLDDWAAKLLLAHSGPLQQVTLTDGVPLLDADPHVWLDPIIVRDHLLPAVVAALARADPGHRDAFVAGAAAVREQLTALDREIRAALTPLPHKRYIAFHSAWRYFSRRYGLDEIGVVEPFPGKEPTAGEIATLVEKARADGIHAVFTEPQFDPRLARVVARDCGARLVTVDPIGGEELAGRSHYVDLMRYNLHAFVGALR